MLPRIDIIYGGFPCQDISCAGRGKGLEGERSGLFFEIMRLVDEIQPSFIFLENVPAITARGLGAVTAEITRRGYDSRWTTLSAAEVGANHKRQRWWLLAHTSGKRRQQNTGGASCHESKNERGATKNNNELERVGKEVADTEPMRELQQKGSEQNERRWSCNESWWRTEPDVGRVVNGLPFRVDRIKGLGNSVVPQCAREAFKELSGLQEMGRCF
jgi:DNA (cytosine-5)-methyltransferase 1